MPFNTISALLTKLCPTWSGAYMERGRQHLFMVGLERGRQAYIQYAYYVNAYPSMLELISWLHFFEAFSNTLAVF